MQQWDRATWWLMSDKTYHRTVWPLLLLLLLLELFR